MKTVFTAVSIAVLAMGIAPSPAVAMPGLTTGAASAPTTPSIEKVRVVCNWRRCWHVGYYHYYGYHYYRPYYGYYHHYYAPHLGVGVGPFGVRIF